MGDEDRKRAGVEREYADERIAVSWEPRLCIHTANCLKAEPEVFDSRRRPWIKLTAATAESVASAVMKCPTGALHFRRLDDGPQEQAPEETSVEPSTNGPLFVRGSLRFVTPRGEVIREDTRAALCRCGESSNKPFCDGTHQLVGFRSE